MPRPYPPEFRARAVALVRAGKQAKQTAVELLKRQHYGRAGFALLRRRILLAH
ncbi:hypothetical protein AB0I51_40860 [Streptomyces sp. NPDC050549]|uniref:hypothetical protein n=1 Tax=Streptomyces sp. NPDC050549 TaxID=3155406 RepID=UPI00342649A0